MIYVYNKVFEMSLNRKTNGSKDPMSPKKIKKIKKRKGKKRRKGGNSK